MENKRKYHIVVGSKKFFDDKIQSFLEDDTVDTFYDLVKKSDNARNNHQLYTYHAKKLIVINDNYHAIVETAHDRLGSLIEELTTSNAEIYIHNPPRVLKSFLNNEFNQSLIDMDFINEEYSITRNPEDFKKNIDNISKKIVGQKKAIEEVSKSLWYLTNVKRKNPYVVMLYGNSSLGKTELVREIANLFYSGKYLEKHLSMFKNDKYFDEFFGNASNRRSLGFELLERESNLVFFDELDKCPDCFYSAFYTLFDNIEFKDTTYDVDISGLVIFLTSNYHTEEEMKKELGLPLFYRIDKFIHFDDFNFKTINQIVLNEISNRKEELEDKINMDTLYSYVSKVVLASGENARTIKYKIQQVIEQLLFESIANQNKENDN